MKASIFLLPLFFTGLIQASEPPQASIQFPDLSAMPDRTTEFRERLAANGGTLLLEPGVHRITGTLEVALSGQHSALIRPAEGPATLIMDGPGPAIRIVGSHEGTASPKSFQPKTFHERMPLVENIEIIGNHPEADGIELVRTFEAVVSKVAVRWCRDGIRLFERNRNVTISGVNLYENQGIGLHLDDVNLHQINVSNSHISYNRGGGIVVRDGNVRNLQITGCDIEANMPGDDTPTRTANI
ncbi:MAG: right-handed parallel beta-helix repeat-containing protein, partial [Verrucomicrobiae bacterium]|nr:right-handed parallel beta-helix repeat-containing protein [Verrucomicrobiae bacterium]